MNATGIDNQGMQWSLTPAKYSKGNLIFKVANTSGWKTQAQSLACSKAINGRYTHREKGFVLSPKKAEKLLVYICDGWNASDFTGELIPPGGF